MCNPCVVNYDFVGKYETLRDDSAELLRRTGLAGSLTFPQRNTTIYYKATSGEDRLLRKNYRHGPLSLGRRLYEKYESDFLLFGYSFHEEWFARRS
ncbi:PREDICTED: carbohydrate sulfotransferase 11-like [Priapulus caudatus]|uniref:Carbohydrate sulfotransferase n=1 Tax=Priapulus caudatus TaxID=37621 RepID=A0ABM1DSP1_PRICU|nr:PREDICTED: carbohydrate sulfotransferase 11-like [Priapulus caudatus]